MTGSMASSTSMEEVCITSFLSESRVMAAKFEAETRKAILLVFESSAGGRVVDPSRDDLPAMKPFVLF